MLFSCTSNTIYEKPDDLIPKDTMVLLIKDLYLAAAAKNVLNKQSQRRFSYVPLVYQKYKIDSVRFQKSNLYYTSKIDIYEPLLQKVIDTLDAERKVFNQLKKVRDSVRQDSIKKTRLERVQMKRNTVKKKEQPKKEKNLRLQKKQ